MFLEIFGAVFLAEIAATACFATLQTLRNRAAQKAYLLKMEAFEAAVSKTQA